MFIYLFYDNNTIAMIIHLLGLAPAGFSTAPDNGPWAMAEVVHVGIPLRSDGYGHLAFAAGYVEFGLNPGT
jgi:hypothetical protein